MIKTIYQIDAFTTEAFKGNPAAVMILDEDIPETLMQNVALEMNLSETAFILPIQDKFQIKYFTPTKEVALCGHATLASAHILYELGIVKSNKAINFQAKETELTVTKEGPWLKMNFPQYPLTKVEIPPSFKALLGFTPLEIYSSSYNWVVAVAEFEEEIINSQPDFEALKTHNLGHLMITAKSDSPDFDYVLRCFAPSLGVNEDPVTGSAQCALGPLWHSKTGKTEFSAKQLSQRGGQLKVKILPERVEIQGQALTIFKAELKS